jgi:hypothetical protein
MLRSGRHQVLGLLLIVPAAAAVGAMPAGSGAAGPPPSTAVDLGVLDAAMSVKA